MRAIKIRRFCTGLFLLCLLQACSKSGSAGTAATGADTTPSIPKPALTGKLVYHRYDTYGGPSAVFLYDFSNGSLQEISKSWALYDPMNAHLNPSGTQIVFMAQAVKDGKWDIYLWSPGSVNVINLTASDGARDEDPKFSGDGTRICFKQTPSGGVGNIKIMKLADRSVTTVTRNTTESGMPYFAAGDTSLLYAEGAGSSSDIYMVNTDGSNNRAVQAIASISEYYPIGSDADAYFFTRWSALSNAHDQIFRGYYSGKTPDKLLFNTADADYSDAAMSAEGNRIISCDKSGGAGAYDLYVADPVSGNLWPLSAWNSQINTTLNELGASYR